MQEGKTIGQLMEEMRQKAGAQNYHGHDYMDLQRFAENTRHMIIFDVLTHDSPVGWKGERTRLFLSEIGYEKALDSQAKGQIKILCHAKVRNGDLMGLFATNFGEAWRLSQGANASEKFLPLFAVLPGAMQSFWPSLHPLDLLVGLCCGASLRLAVYLKSKNAKKHRHGLE